MRAIYLVCLFTALIMAGGCEDKNSSVKKIQEKEKTEQKTDSTPDDKAKAQNDQLKKKMGSIVESQADLKPFLKKYGNNNKETRVRIKTRFGDIEVELYKDTPLHRANFILLVKQDYFNETMMHRVSEGFVVQGGNSDGYKT
ncbi:MAG: peptidylprolyl isomerase, partial [Leeuwenhoekiella sp.]